MRKSLAALAAFLVFLVGCARLDINAINLHKPVVTGGQAQIDAGNVVDVDGLPGIWLAGHHTTHGAVFAHVTDLVVGDEVCVYSHCYHVTRVLDYCSHVSPGYLGPVVLQTSIPCGVRLVVAS